jgi:adenosine kinase
MAGGNYELVSIGNPLLDMQIRDAEEVLKKVRARAKRA